MNTEGGGSPGVADGQHGKEDGADGAMGIGSGTRRKMMLMIEDAKTEGPKKSVLEELNEIPLDDPNMFDDTSKSFKEILSYFLLSGVYSLSVYRDTCVRSISFSIISCRHSFASTHHTWS